MQFPVCTLLSQSLRQICPRLPAWRYLTGPMNGGLGAVSGVVRVQSYTSVVEGSWGVFAPAAGGTTNMTGSCRCVGFGKPTEGLVSKAQRRGKSVKDVGEPEQSKSVGSALFMGTIKIKMKKHQ
jgi:hypothetical protein